MEKIYFKVSMILLSLMLLSNRAMAEYGEKGSGIYKTKEGGIYYIESGSNEVETYINYLEPYMGFGVDVSKNFGLKSSIRANSVIRVNSATLGLRKYSYAFGRDYDKESYFVPAYELEYREIHITNNKGEVVLNPMVNVNIYMSLYPQFHSITHPKNPSDTPFIMDNPLDYLDVYGTIGVGKGKYANDLSIGGGVGIADAVQLEVKHTKFFGARTKGNTSAMVKFNIPIVIIGAPVEYVLSMIFWPSLY